MKRDPIIEEVRAARDALAREHGYDLKAIVAALQRSQAESGRQVVTFSPKRVPETGAARKAS